MTTNQLGTLDNRYELQSVLGEGGMAVVYKALDNRLSRLVAVKIMRENYASDPQFLSRFKREAQQAASLNHPNIVKVFDVGQQGNAHYIVMEYIEGISLKDKIIATGALPIKQAVEIGAEVCDAIGYAHQMGLIHRDVKPQNILLDKSGTVKVTDFGIAKSATSATLTEVGMTLGTVHYFSPEQAKGEQVLPQSDIYSIGVVLYEMLTGQIPFDSDNPVALALKHINEPPPPLRKLNPAVPPALEQMVLKALAKNPAGRYATANDLSALLRSYESQAAQGTAVAAPPANGAGKPPPPRQATPPRPVTPPVQVPQPGATMVNPVRPVVPRNPVRPQAGAYNPPPLVQQPPPSYVDPYASQTSYPGGAVVSRRTVVETQYDDIPESPKNGCATFVFAGLAFLMVAALVVAGILFLPTLTQPRPATATAPAVVTTLPVTTPATVVKVRIPAQNQIVGKTRQEVEDILKAAKLQVGDIRQQTNAGVAPDRVITTDPNPGSEVEVNSRVAIILSRGPDTVAIPEYVNTPPNLAKQQLEQLGFKVEQVEEFNATVQKGAVSGTDPKVGFAAAKGSTVKLLVSKGPAPTPTVAATATATAVPATATPVPPSPTPAPTTVPPPPVTVPNVVGKLYTDVKPTLDALAVMQVLKEVNEKQMLEELAGTPPEYQQQASQLYKTLPDGAVLGTNPPGGSQIRPGTRLVVLIKKDK